MRIRNLLLLLLCIAATVLSAQVVIRGEDSLTGTVSSPRGGRIGILDDRAVTLSGGAEQVDGRTVVLNGETRVDKSLQLGDRVAVTAMTMSGGKVLALEIAREPRHRVVNH
jgi:hypothetical protein